MLKERIERLKNDLVTFASHVEGMIKKSMEGLIEKREDVLKEVVEKDEPKANQWEVKIEEVCTQLIAQFCPRAKDLRTILMIFSMNNDLERMGDHSVNIAESALYLIKRPMVKPLIDLPRMAEITIGMVEDSIKSFVEEDAELSRDVCVRDNLVDNLRDQIFRELVTYMVSDPSTIERSMHLLRISRNLERIADLSTNIAEDVIFMVKGEVIKHGMGE